MANTVTTTYPINGSRCFVAKIDIVGDTAAELSAVTAIDPANLTGVPGTFKISKVAWQFSEFSASLWWDATADTLAFALNQYEGEMDFKDFSGIPIVNNAGDGKTGKLLISTAGFGAGDRGTIIITGYHE